MGVALEIKGDHEKESKVQVFDGSEIQIDAFKKSGLLKQHQRTLGSLALEKLFCRVQ